MKPCAGTTWARFASGSTRSRIRAATCGGRRRRFGRFRRSCNFRSPDIRVKRLFKSVEQLSKALDWDEEHDNRFTSKTEHAKEYQETRLGFEQLHSDMQMGARLLEKARKGESEP